MAPHPNPLHLSGDRPFDYLYYSGCLHHTGGQIDIWSCGECAYRRLSQEMSVEYIDFQMGLSDGQAQQTGDRSDPEEMGLNFVDDNEKGRLRLERPFDSEAMAEYIDFQMGVHHPQGAGGFGLEEISPFVFDDQADMDGNRRQQKEAPWVCPEEIGMEFADCGSCFYNPREHRI